MKHPFLIFLLFLCGGFSAVAQPSGNPLVFGENRLTLITPTLFRLEFAHDGKFIDDPTYFAYDRGSLLPASEFRVRELGGNRYEISTSALRIVYEHDGFPFGLHNFAAYYKLNGKEKKFTNRCIFRNNLGGPVETLDRVTGEIPMQDGLLSRDGWYVIDDERSDLLVDGFSPSMDALQRTGLANRTLNATSPSVRAKQKRRLPFRQAALCDQSLYIAAAGPSPPRAESSRT